jgi:hypothetical protein
LAAALAVVAVGAAGRLGSRTLEESGPARERGSRAVAPSGAEKQDLVVASASADPYAGHVVASSDARWSQRREGELETVALESGRVALRVRPQRIGERFLVSLPDGELEVRGTAFEVDVEGGSTRAVVVSEGAVDLRLEGRESVRLEAGASWPPPSAVPAPAPPAETRAARESPAPREADGYAVAMGLLRGGHNEEAAAAFHAFAQAHRGAPQAEDASFLEAVALARAGRSDAAALSAERHLAAFPRSFHRRDAAILVARAAAQRGECERAEAVLAGWNGKGDPEVQAALRACERPR